MQILHIPSAGIFTFSSKTTDWGLINGEEWVKAFQVPHFKLVLTYTWHPVQFDNSYNQDPKICNERARFLR